MRTRNVCATLPPTQSCPYRRYLHLKLRLLAASSNIQAPYDRPAHQ